MTYTPREAAHAFPDVSEPPTEYTPEQRAEFLDERRRMKPWGHPFKAAPAADEQH
jgi:hypothetical protein